MSKHTPGPWRIERDTAHPGHNFIRPSVAVGVHDCDAIPIALVPRMVEALRACEIELSRLRFVLLPTHEGRIEEPDLTVLNSVSAILREIDGETPPSSYAASVSFGVCPKCGSIEWVDTGELRPKEYRRQCQDCMHIWYEIDE